ncbi:hypothetical protein M422DRAFT_267747 [Sphaerobolus stellatus SS14]|uniref:Uncharacterized protein n=1 Tax=Sphaerobolus stellatus (strain SS14) TaxID=990650 RepID=A0A0C9UP61_SPHS4|nr:hypothetical protein M422DRAFT_267747 [Sphaerobolus stellatus SS14]
MMVNTLAVAVAPSNIDEVFVPWAVAVPYVMGSRLLLRMRRCLKGSYMPSGPSGLSSFMLGSGNNPWFEIVT